MNKYLAIAGIFTFLLGIAVCGRQSPRQRQPEIPGTMKGILEDQNENVLVVRSRDGREHLFWMNGGITCPAENGDSVVVTYEETMAEDSKVMTLLSLKKTVRKQAHASLCGPVLHN